MHFIIISFNVTWVASSSFSLVYNAQISNLIVHFFLGV
ncbi:hypothetical protein GLYMA_16G155450v4 [Glycine max]|nr:hypothetical protein GLYMA_16G155450v4 [Glycine max]KAH1151581.1 hypothetical protein GYH30_045200 [Glycine max]